MSERTNIPFTNEHFCNWLLRMEEKKSVYWYGSCIYKCTESLRSRKAKQYPSHYKENRTARYKQDIAAKQVCGDCVGACKGYAWSGGGQGTVEAIGTDASISNEYGSNGCPDRSASGMFSYAKSKGMDWGTIDTLPEIVGVALHTDGHVGYYVGGGYAVEWRGFSYGCVKTKVASRTWTHWYRMPFIDYGNAFEDGATSAITQPVENTALGSRLLTKGAQGADVKALQELLLQLGYELPKYGADGKYGNETRAAVMAFQKDAELEEDGKYGEETHKAFMDAVADDEEGQKDEGNAGDADAGSGEGTPAEGNPAQDGSSGNEADAPQTQPDTPDASTEEKKDEEDQSAVGGITSNGNTVVIISEGGKVNIRYGNDTSYGRISQVAPGTTFAWVATAQNGWHAIKCAGKVGWVSGQFSRRI